MHTLSTPWLLNCEACTVIIKPFSHFNEYDVDDAFNDMICGLVLVFCVSISIEGEGICGVQVP